jgi:hypothetical protein
MAKKRRGSTKSAARKTSRKPDRLATFAEDLGRMLGTTQARASAWMNQRKAVAKQLAEIRDTAAGLLQELAKQTPWGGARKRTARGRRKTAKARKR